VGDVEFLRCAARLHVGKRVSDEEFDSVYDGRARAVSFRHWTPVIVACRAARLLTELGATRILDVGAGVGKFCIVGALTTAAAYCGVERRGDLVDVARAAAARFGAQRATFTHANILDFDSDQFDGFYIYNPFEEHLEYDPLPIDEAVAPSPDLYRMCVVATTARLVRARPGTTVVTFNGLGGPMPSDYRQVRRERFFDADLTLWIKRANVQAVGEESSSDRSSVGT
jgi:SAM-dependent methyltransferase